MSMENTNNERLISVPRPPGDKSAEKNKHGECVWTRIAADKEWIAKVKMTFLFQRTNFKWMSVRDKLLQCVCVCDVCYMSYMAHCIRYMPQQYTISYIVTKPIFRTFLLGFHAIPYPKQWHNIEIHVIANISFSSPFFLLPKFFHINFRMHNRLFHDQAVCPNELMQFPKVQYFRFLSFTLSLLDTSFARIISLKMYTFSGEQWLA